jgi:hypothetical protein
MPSDLQPETAVLLSLQTSLASDLRSICDGKLLLSGRCGDVREEIAVCVRLYEIWLSSAL